MNEIVNPRVSERQAGGGPKALRKKTTQGVGFRRKNRTKRRLLHGHDGKTTCIGALTGLSVDMLQYQWPYPNSVAFLDCPLSYSRVESPSEETLRLPTKTQHTTPLQQTCNASWVIGGDHAHSHTSLTRVQPCGSPMDTFIPSGRPRGYPHTHERAPT